MILRNLINRKRVIPTFVSCVIGVFSTFSTVNAADVFQLNNNGFEVWESSTKPKNWNTYETCIGSLSGMAKNDKQCERSTDVRPGSTGQYSAKTKVKTLLGIPANGNLTSGVIEAGSATATSTDNHNITIPGNSSQSTVFTGRPDSITVWVKMNLNSSSQKGRIYLLLHGNYKTQDPGTNWKQVCAVAGTNPVNNKTWTRYALPFYYQKKGESITIENNDGVKTLTPACTDERPSYVLTSFSTNFVPGKGDGSDQMNIDDIVMVYNSKLSSLKINGTAVPGFSKDVFNYTATQLYTEGCVTAVSDGKFATIEQNFNKETGTLTITVKGDDYSANSANKHVYSIKFPCPAEISSFKFNGTAIADYSPATFEYDLGKKVYDKSKITYTTPDCVSTTETWDATDNTLSIAVAALGVTNNYKFIFHAPFGSSLKTLKIGGTAVANFNPATLSYTTAWAYNEADLAYTADDEATVTTQYDTRKYILTITVKGGDFDENPSNSHVYKIQYHAPYGASLKTLTVNGKTVSGFSPTIYSYSVKSAYIEGTTKIAYTADADATVEEAYDSKTSTVSVTVKGADFSFNPANTHTYKIGFHDSYGSLLKSISIDGATLPDFDPATLTYSTAKVYKATELDYVADDDATATHSFDSKTFLLTITVKGGDFAENPTNSHVYKIQYHAPYGSALTSLKINGTAVSNFSTTKFSYNVPDVYTEGTTKVTYTADAEATVDQSYDSKTSTLTITVKGGDFATNSSNVNTYKIGFHAAYGSQLSTIKVNRTPLDDFEADTYTYNVSDTYEEGCISVDADDDATVETSYKDNQFVIVVKGGDFATNPSNTHSYTINFSAPSVLTDFTVNGKTITGFKSSKYSYDLTAYVYENIKADFKYSTGATVEKDFDASNSVLTIKVSGSDIAKFPTNFHTYVFNFHSSYGSQLTELKIDGTMIDDFAKGNYEYLVKGDYYDFETTFKADADAKTKAQFNDDTHQLVIEVTGADIAENPKNKHSYTIQFYAPSRLTSLKVNGSNVAGFASTKYDYSLPAVAYNGAKIVKYAEEGATIEEKYDESSNTLSLIVKGADIATFPDNTHTYTLSFGEMPKSQLSTLKINGSEIANFSKDLYNYTSESFYDDVKVTYTADKNATTSEQFDKATFTLTIRVEGSNISSNPNNFHTYTITFADPTVYGSQLSALKQNGESVIGFSKDVYKYIVDGSFSNIKITYSADEKASVSERFNTKDNSLALIVEGGNIEKDPTNTHTYTVQFTSSFAYEAKVVALNLNGSALDGFNSNVFNSTSTNEYTDDLNIEVSPLAQYCANYDKQTGVLTIVVWAGDFNTNKSNFNTYKVSFKH